MDAFQIVLLGANDMKDFILEYETIIKPQIDAAVEDALKNEVADAALQALHDSAQQRVYDAWTPTIDNRRYSLLDKKGTYNCVVQGNTLTITAQTSFQGTQTSDDLGDVIEKGLKNYRMPFPRPWMEEGIQDNLTAIEAALEVGLTRQGFVRS